MTEKEHVPPELDPVRHDERLKRLEGLFRSLIYLIGLIFVALASLVWTQFIALLPS